ncbi:hypothetical protein J6590_029250 [Homalodisca vitripennis]|nr:hypothetical protein J6590_029250 [Homalodisca vitripennis]
MHCRCESDLGPRNPPFLPPFPSTGQINQRFTDCGYRLCQTFGNLPLAIFTAVGTSSPVFTPLSLTGVFTALVSPSGLLTVTHIHVREREHNTGRIV